MKSYFPKTALRSGGATARSTLCSRLQSLRKTTRKWAVCIGSTGMATVQTPFGQATPAWGYERK